MGEAPVERNASMTPDRDDTVVPEHEVAEWIRIVAYSLVAIYYAGRIALLV